MHSEEFSPKVEVIRSPRRRKSIAARLVDDRIEVRVPAALDPAEERRLVDEVVAKLKAKKTATVTSDAELLQRATHLNTEVLGGRARIGSIRWVTNQNFRWGSCTVLTGDIRISHRLQEVPDYVLNAVIVHELVHTFITDGHSKDFWHWADKVPQAERAKGFLEAWQHCYQASAR
ncbi:MAG: DUF45 domain-containing protein [Corynebacterium sp.]|uniref:M48 metallopeptidase family protein n=1 Tax=Corynebacterium sp. TaxID=1720 RepID=UPI0026DAEAA8|nr:YgjP-like metallopeptidase domain-containing protein [Corynebacterium sp.]MDO5097563.1 DUF45 domain-containing protein [Corynebacterium sp.]